MRKVSYRGRLLREFTFNEDKKKRILYAHKCLRMAYILIHGKDTPNYKHLTKKLKNRQNIKKH